MLCRNKKKIFKAVLCIVPGFSFVFTALCFVYAGNQLVPVRTHFQNKLFVLAGNNARFQKKNYKISLFNHCKRTLNNVIIKLSLFTADVTGQLVTAGINKMNRLSVNNGCSFYRVTGNARLIIYNCNAAVQKPVKKCRFSNIRTARNYNCRQAFIFHIFRRNSVLKLNILRTVINKIRFFYNNIILLKILIFFRTALRLTKIRFLFFLCHIVLLYRNMGASCYTQSHFAVCLPAGFFHFKFIS